MGEAVAHAEGELAQTQGLAHAPESNPTAGGDNAKLGGLEVGGACQEGEGNLDWHPRDQLTNHESNIDYTWQ